MNVIYGNIKFVLYFFNKLVRKLINIYHLTNGSYEYANNQIFQHGITIMVELFLFQSLKTIVSFYIRNQVECYDYSEVLFYQNINVGNS